MSDAMTPNSTGTGGVTLVPPTEIKQHLDDYVIEQEDAKKVLSVAVYNHYKRVNYKGKEIELKKSNVMMVGPTGSGKTLLARTLAKILNVPFAEADATSFITAGVVGGGVESIMLKLLQAAEFDVARAQVGIVYIDEVDKLKKSDYNRGAGEGIQQALLKIIEGTVVVVKFQGKEYQIDTDHVLFIVGGAFVGLAEIVRMRMGSTDAGLLSESELIKDAAPGDLAKFGLIPEFIGRIPVIVSLAELSKETLVDVLTKPKNALVEQYKKMFSLDGIELVFEPQSLITVANMAIELRTGARGLRTIMEDRMLEVMYSVPGQKDLRRIYITSAVMTRTGKPRYEYVQSTEEKELEPLVPNPTRNKSAFAD